MYPHKTVDFGPPDEKRALTLGRNRYAQTWGVDLSVQGSDMFIENRTRKGASGSARIPVPLEHLEAFHMAVGEIVSRHRFQQFQQREERHKAEDEIKQGEESVVGFEGWGAL